MKIEQLELIVEILRTNSISAAADNLHLTRQSVSQSLHSLENELEVLIFDRSKQGCAPTPAGEIVLKYAQMMLANAKEMRAALKRLSIKLAQDFKGHIYVYFSQHYFLRSAIIINIMKDFFPNSLFSSHVYSDTAAFPIVNTSEDGTQIMTFYFSATLYPETLAEQYENIAAVKVLMEEPMYVCMSKKNRLSSLPELQWEQLERLPFGAFGRDNASPTFVEQYFEAHGAKAHCSFIADNVNLLSAQMNENNTCALTPIYETKQLLKDNLYQFKMLPIKDGKPLTHFAAYQLPAEFKALSPYIELMLDDIKEALS